ncbi:MAG: hypothetical protein LBS07_04125, partial [Prevotellaceae bacterium]|nr:hypothetical protein [Prevotellaceae bacterium]
MAKSKEPKAPKGKKAKQMGYVSFSKEDVNTGDDRNTRAEELFLQALNVPKRVQKKTKKGKGKELEDNDFYPTSLPETQEMEILLNQAEAAVDDPSDKEFMNNLAEMRGIVDWSKKRQWNFNWSTIIGVIVFVFVLNQCSKSAKEDVVRAEQELATVKNWGDSAIVAYKTVELERKQQNLKYYQENLAASEARLDTITDKERKKSEQGSIKRYKENIKEYTDDIAKLQKADHKEVHKMAVKQHEDWLKSKKGSSRSALFWFIFFLILIPLYIVAERPYGYNISKHRTEAAVLGGIRKIMNMFAGGLASIAGALYVTETVTSYTDGSKSRSDDGMAIYAMKAILLLGALAIFVFTSVFLMLYSTIAGLARNYNWRE